MTDLNHTIRKFNRFELKYMVTLAQAERFKSALRAYMRADDYGAADGRYTIASLYYDSPEFRCYWEKVDGIRFRRKLRLRLYDDGQPVSDGTPVFVEIKQRIDRVTQKRRILLPYGQASKLCSRRDMIDAAPQDQPVVEEVYAFLWQYNLRPASIVRYTRQAFIGAESDLGLRVTFDTSLRYQTMNLDLADEELSTPIMGENWVVMEIKVNERIPYWLTEMVAAHNLQLYRISKYCRSIEVAKQYPSTYTHFALAAI